jgi:hypothetical protein
VIQKLDKEFGLDVPIFAFGYSKFRRCISQRSSKRVPTHILVSLGKYHSIENFVQALGRGTFNGRESVLKQNGHDDVTLFTDEEDFKAARKYVNFFEKLVERLKGGETLDDALNGTIHQFPDSTNFLRHTGRKIGLREDLKHRLMAADIFKEEDYDNEYDLGGGDDTLKQKYWENTLAQRVLKTFEYLREEDDIIECKEKQICDKFNETYQEDGAKMTRDSLRIILKDYVKDKVLEKNKSGSAWHVLNWEIANHMMNDEYFQ